MSQMNYLLIMPRFVDKIGEWYQFPLGIPYISSCLKQKGFNLKTLNLNSLNGSVYDILEKYIKKYDIHVILTGGLSFQYNGIKEICTTAKQINSNIITIVGGGIITSAPIPGMKVLELADYGIIGEGEVTTCELCHALESRKDLSAVDGIIFRRIDQFIITNKRQEIENLDTIPFPDYAGFGFSEIINTVASLLAINETHAITMSTSRSCPFQCTFCFHTSGSKYRQRSLDNFFEELNYLVETYGIKYISISDELFAQNMTRVKEFCKRIKTYNIKWFAQFRVPDVTEELVMILKDSNCVTMGFGLESADNRILKSMKKAITIEQTEHALELVYRAGIAIQGCFIFGDVEETLETAMKTLEWWKNHLHYGIALNFITTYPGTPLYKYACEKGIIKDEVQFIKDGCPVINVSRMLKNDLEWLAEQVVNLPQMLLKEPFDVKQVTVNYENSSVSLMGKCTVCGAQNSWHDIRFFTRTALICSSCGERHKLPIEENIIERIDDSLLELISEYGEVAFWGINDYFADISQRFKNLANAKIFFIDVSSIKQGSIINGKKVYAPSILKQQRIKMVIIPVISLVTTIEKQIRNDFKEVEKIISVLELIK